MCNLLFLSGASDGRCLKCRSSCNIWLAHFQIHCRYGKLWPFLADLGGQAGVQVEVALQLQPCYEYCQCNMRLVFPLQHPKMLNPCTSIVARLFCSQSMWTSAESSPYQWKALWGAVIVVHSGPLWERCPLWCLLFFFNATILLRVDYKGYLLLQSEWQFLNYPSNQGISYLVSVSVAQECQACRLVRPHGGIFSRVFCVGVKVLKKNTFVVIKFINSAH